MAVIINDFELYTDPEETRSTDRTRPSGEEPRVKDRSLSPSDILDVIEWEEVRTRRTRAH